MNEHFIFGDAHSEHRSVLDLLEQEGLYDSYNKVRLRPEVIVVSIGDLANCVRSSRDDDMQALELVGPVVDFLIVGNHEAPYLGFTAFNGFFNFPEIKDLINELNRNGNIVPSLSVNGILVSHAGLVASLGKTFESAEEATQAITEAYYISQHERRNDYFNAVGHSRGGYGLSSHKGEGGVLWSDWSESKSHNFAQLVGHSAGENIRIKTPTKRYSVPHEEGPFNPEKNAYCIDIGCNKTGFYPSAPLAGAFIHPDGKMSLTVLK